LSLHLRVAGRRTSQDDTSRAELGLGEALLRNERVDGLLHGLDSLRVDQRLYSGVAADAYLIRYVLSVPRKHRIASGALSMGGRFINLRFPDYTSVYSTIPGKPSQRIYAVDDHLHTHLHMAEQPTYIGTGAHEIDAVYDAHYFPLCT
jgi:hypothetical protein